MIIYRATNKVNGKAYIGQTVRTLEQRKVQHLKSKNCRAFNHALQKYGSENFEWDVLYTAPDLETLNFMEDYYITKHNTLGPDGYNLMAGGKNGVHSEETKQKISKAKIGIRCSESTKEKIGNANRGNKSALGKKHSLESQQKRSKTLKGRRLSDEHRLKLSESHKGLKQTEQTIKKRLESRKDYQHSEETKNKIRESWKLRKQNIYKGIKGSNFNENTNL